MACECGCRPGACEGPKARDRGPPAPCECSARPEFAGAPGMPEPLSRFDIFEEMRRRGFPAAFPQGWDGRPLSGFAPQARRLGPPDGSEGAPGRAPGDGGPLVPDFFDESQRRWRATLGDAEILSPGFVRSPPGDPARRAEAPYGGLVEFEELEPALRPVGSAFEGGLVPWEGLGPPDEPQAPGRPETVAPPQLTARQGGAAETALLAQDPRERERRPEPEPAPEDRVSREAPEGSQRSEKADGEAQAGAQECVRGPDAFQAEFGFGDPIVVGAPQGRGGGGGGGEEEEEEEKTAVTDVQFIDPCPCKCVCKLPPLVQFIQDLFVTVAGFLERVDRSFRRSDSLLGLPEGWRPPPLVGTPDGFVEQVLLDSRLLSGATYHTPAGTSPGAAGLLDGMGPGLRVEPAAGARPEPPVLVVAGLSEVGEPLTRMILPVPVGPGPGIPGVGAEPMRPLDGTRFEAAPGSLPAGLAPGATGEGLGEVGERLRRDAAAVRATRGPGA